MKKLKRICVFLCLFLGVLGVTNVFAMTTNPNTEIANQFVKKVESLIANYETPKQLAIIDKIQSRLNSLQNDLNSVQMKKYSDESCDSICKEKVNQKIQEYNEIIYAISSGLNSLESKLKNVELDELIDAGEGTFTEKEYKKVEESILKLQKLAYDKVYDKYLYQLNLEKSCKYEQKGKIDGEILLQNSSLGQGKVDITYELNDFLMKTNCKDFKMDGDVKVSIDVEDSSNGKTYADVDFVMSMITKAYDNYLKLDDVSVSGLVPSQTDKDKFLILKQMEELGKYIKLPSGYSTGQTMFIESMRDFVLGKGVEKLYAEPFFKLYKKEGDKYYIIPSKIMCNRMMMLEYYSYGYGKMYCSDEDYMSFIKDMLVYDIMPYIEYDGKNTILGFDYKDDQGKAKVRIVYNDTIESIEISIYPMGEGYEGQGITFDYEENTKLDFWMNVDERENILVDFKSKIKDDRFVTIDGTIEVSEEDYFSNEIKEVINGYLNLKDNELDGKLVVKDPYESFKLEMNLDGKTDSRNRLEKLNIGVSVFDLTYDKKLADISLELYKPNGELKSGKFDMMIEYAMGKILANIELKDKKIEGRASVAVGGSEIFSTEMKGEYEKGYLLMDNGFELDVGKMYGGFYSGSQDMSYKGDVKLKLDTRNNNQDGMFDLSVKNPSNEEIVKYYINADMSKEDKNNISIEAPSNFAEIEDLEKIEVDLENLEVQK